MFNFKKSQDCVHFPPAHLHCYTLLLLILFHSCLYYLYIFFTVHRQYVYAAYCQLYFFVVVFQLV